MLLCAAALLESSCMQVLSAANRKTLAPEVAEAGLRSGNWYVYLPERAPGYCLMTAQTLVWHDPDMHIGHWRGLHPDPPHRVLMEAHGDTFTLYHHYVWDGMTWGHTEPRHLKPTLLHDALYHALQGGAPFERKEADLAFLRACRGQKLGDAFGEYLAVRWFGGLFNRTRAQTKTIVVEPLQP